MIKKSYDLEYESIPPEDEEECLDCAYRDSIACLSYSLEAMEDCHILREIKARQILNKLSDKKEEKK